MPLSRSDFLASVAGGSYASDLELVDCYNVLTERGDTSDSSFEKQARRYKLLPHLSRTVWHNRLGILVYFNRILSDVLPFADLSLALTSPEAAFSQSSSWLVRSVHSVRGLIVSKLKLGEWTKALAATVHNSREQIIGTQDSPQFIFVISG
jgi:hypothetical protein